MDELQISGKRFISSRRIARDNGYTADYIGQLIRGGKVTGQKVGRAWYVDATSFEGFLGSERTPDPVVAAPGKEKVEIAPEPILEVAPETEPVKEVAPLILQEKIKEKIPEIVIPVVEKPEEKISEPVLVIQKEEEPQRIPLHRLKK